MKKKWIISISVILLLILISLSILLMRIPYFKNRIYLKDRITGTFSMLVDGKPYNPTDETLEYEDDGTQRLADDGAGNFTIKGGEYGRYKIGFILENDELFELTQDPIFKSYDSDPTLTFFYINANWWHITKMTLTAEMVLSGDKWVINCKVVYKESTEDGGFIENTAQKSFTYDEVMAGNGIIRFGL